MAGGCKLLNMENGKIEYWGRRLEKNPNWTENLKFLDKFLENVPPGTLLDCELYSTKGRERNSLCFKENWKGKTFNLCFRCCVFQWKIHWRKNFKREEKDFRKNQIQRAIFCFRIRTPKKFKKINGKISKKGL